tara:strand:- start:213 stop:728 length:516 start_codon:yes stop_codon:yes gene_type:complete
MPFTKLLPTSIDLAQNFTFTGTVAGAGGGKVLQVVEGTHTSDTFTTSGTFSDIISLAITPSATSSKVLAFASAQYNNYGNGSSNFPNGQAQIIDHDGNALTRAYGNASGNQTGDSTDQFDSSISLQVLDSPNSTSAQTYKLQHKCGSGRFGLLGASTRLNGTKLTLIEIGA